MKCLSVCFIAACVLTAGCDQREPNSPEVSPDEEPTLSQKLYLKPPPDWVERSVDGAATGLYGPAIEGFHPNIVLVLERDRSSLADYCDISIRALEQEVKDFKLLERATFTTSGGLEGIRWSCLIRFQEKRNQVAYFAFDAGPGKKHLYVCTVQASHGEELAPKFDEIIRTYQP